VGNNQRSSLKGIGHRQSGRAFVLLFAFLIQGGDNMAQATLDTPISNMTLGELKEFIRDVIREERRGECYLDDDGWLTFYGEESYARYLAAQKEKLSGEINNPLTPFGKGDCFFDEQGFRVYYSDYMPTDKKRQQLKQAKQEIDEGRIHFVKRET
jgi:hypothetical protein